MNSICENEIQEEIIDLLEENCSITMKVMAENALMGLNMATKKSVEEVIKEEKYKSDENNTNPKSRFYEEVLAILNYYLKEEDYDRIPKEKIEFFEENADKEYKYKIDKSKSYEEQNISKKANSVLVSLYREYFVSEEEKKVLDQILSLNEANLKKIEEYEKALQNTERVPDERALVKYGKEGLWMKIIRKIRRKLAKGA